MVLASSHGLMEVDWIIPELVYLRWTEKAHEVV
jgi:hypothetical protein